MRWERSSERTETLMRSGVHMPAFTNPHMSASPICMHTSPQSLSVGGQMLHLLHVQAVGPLGIGCLGRCIWTIEWQAVLVMMLSVSPAAP